MCSPALESREAIASQASKGGLRARLPAVLAIVASGVAVLAARAVPATAPVVSTGTTAIVGVDILDMADGTRIRGQTVVVTGDTIRAAGPAAEIPVPGDALVVEGRGKVLMPGLCDMHVHVRQDPAQDFQLYLANGITTVRNMSAADGGWDHVALREKVRSGDLLAPRYLIAGPFVDEESVGSLEELETLLQVYEDGDYDFIKVHGDLEPEVFDTLIVRAARMGVPVVGHAQRHREPRVSLRMKSISHMEEFLYILPWSAIGDVTRHGDLAERLAATNVAVAPTLRIYEIIMDYLDDGALAELAEAPAARYLPPEERSLWLSDGNEYRDPDAGYLRYMMSMFSTSDPAEARALAAGKTRRRFQIMKSFTAAMQKTDVLLISGSDGFGLVVPGLSLHEELETLVEAGLSPLEALQTSTINVARYLGEEDRSGTVSEGKVGDLLLLGADPTLDIRNSRKIDGVMTRGRWLDGAALDAMRESVLEARNP